jgi:hypothetical protein
MIDRAPGDCIGRPTWNTGGRANRSADEARRIVAASNRGLAATAVRAARPREPPCGRIGSDKGRTRTRRSTVTDRRTSEVGRRTNWLWFWRTELDDGVYGVAGQLKVPIAPRPDCLQITYYSCIM